MHQQNSFIIVLQKKYIYLASQIHIFFDNCFLLSVFRAPVHLLNMYFH